MDGVECSGECVRVCVHGGGGGAWLLTNKRTTNDHMPF